MPPPFQPCLRQILRLTTPDYFLAPSLAIYTSDRNWLDPLFQSTAMSFSCFIFISKAILDPPIVIVVKIHSIRVHHPLSLKLFSVCSLLTFSTPWIFATLLVLPRWSLFAIPFGNRLIRFWIGLYEETISNIKFYRCVGSLINHWCLCCFVSPSPSWALSHMLSFRNLVSFSKNAFKLSSTL